MKRTIEVPVIRHQKESWEKTPYFCPNCGEQPVWVDDGPMYDNAECLHFCVTCKAEFFLHSVSPLNQASDPTHLGRLKRAELLSQKP